MLVLALVNDWECRWGRFCSGFGWMGGILSGWEKRRREVDDSEDLAEVGWSVEVDSGEFFRKMWVVGSKERMCKPPL